MGLPQQRRSLTPAHQTVQSAATAFVDSVISGATGVGGEVARRGGEHRLSARG